MQRPRLINHQVIMLLSLLLAACSQAPAASDVTPVAPMPTTAAPTVTQPAATPTAAAPLVQSHLQAALALIPDTSSEVMFVDWEQIKAETGFPQLTGLGGETERSRFFDAIARTQALARAVGLGRFPENTAGWQLLYEHWGWTSADLVWEASALPPSSVLRFRDDFDMRPVVARFEERGYTRHDYHGVALYSHTIDSSPPMWGRLELGLVNTAVLPDEHLLVISSDHVRVRELLDAHAGRQPALSDRPAMQETARLLGPVSSAVVGEGAAVCARLNEMFDIWRRMPSQAEPTSPSARLEEQIQMTERLHPYGAIGAGYRYDGQQLLAQIVLSYEDTAFAKADQPLRQQLAEQGYSLLNLKPFAEFAFTLDGAQLDGGSLVLHVRPVEINPLQILLRVAMPDAVFAGCPSA
jgi:hypothetical protein